MKGWIVKHKKNVCRGPGVTGEGLGPSVPSPPSRDPTRTPGGTSSCNGRQVKTIKRQRHRDRSRGCRFWTRGSSEPAGHGTKRKRVLKRKANPSQPGLLLRSPLLAASLSPAYSGEKRRADLLRISSPSLSVPQRRSFKSKLMKRGCGKAELEISLSGTRKEREMEREAEEERGGGRREREMER